MVDTSKHSGTIAGLYVLGGYHWYPSKGSEFMSLSENVGFNAKELDGFAWECGVIAVVESEKRERAGVGFDIFGSHSVGYSLGRRTYSGDTMYLPAANELRVALFQFGVDFSYGLMVDNFALQIPVGIGGAAAYRSLDGKKDNESMGAFLLRFGIRVFAHFGRFGFMTQCMYDMAKTDFVNALEKEYDFSIGGLRVMGGVVVDITR